MDLVLLKYTNMINGFTALCLAKLDTLDELMEIKVATTYKPNGIELLSFPGKMVYTNVYSFNIFAYKIALVDITCDIELEYVTFLVGVDVQHLNVIHLIHCHIMRDYMCNLLYNILMYLVCILVSLFLLFF